MIFHSEGFPRVVLVERTILLVFLCIYSTYSIHGIQRRNIYKLTQWLYGKQIDDVSLDLLGKRLVMIVYEENMRNNFCV